MDKALSREFAPQGRPILAPNLVDLPRDNGSSINPDRVQSGFKILGHVSQKVLAPSLD